MYRKHYHLEIVSAEKKIFSHFVKNIQISGFQGDLGIFPGHTPLLTIIQPGVICIISDNLQKEIIYISGGILEIQLDSVIILAEKAIYAGHLDKNTVITQKKEAEYKIKKLSLNINYNQLLSDLLQCIAKFRAIELLKK